MTTTDTPRTDACPHCGAEARINQNDTYYCGSWRISTGGVSRTDQCRADERAEKAEAEVKEIRAALGDDGRRTHKEILEMAFKASGWKLWKEKYIDLRNAHIAEGQDPAGTIWEHADKIQHELQASKAEVERLRNELSDWDYGTRAKREQERAERAEAEVERLTKRPFGCKCETLREKVLGDGCDECNKALVIEMLTDERDELEAEVERLKGLLNDLLILTEKNYWNSHNYNQIKEAINPTDK